MESFRLLGKYLSLSALDWTGIPPFAIIAGLNGVGKTQLLQLLAAELDAAPLYTIRPEMKLEPRPTSAGYLPALWQLDDVKVSHEFFEPINDLVQLIEGNLTPPVELTSKIELGFKSITMNADPWFKSLAERVVKGLSKRGKAQLPISRSDVLEDLNTYDLVRYNSTQPVATLAKIFYAHVNARVTAVLRGEPADKIDARLGKPPWDEANRLLQLFEARFQLTSPDDLRFAYELRCHLPESRATVTPKALSSGEQAILALVALAVTTSELGAVGPAREDEDEDDDRDQKEENEQEQETELLLLDEPDAHLHTSMVKRYLEHVQQLTERGIRIIMITHRPDTIALAPEESLFEMRREGDRTSIVKVTSKAELIGRLAGDTIAVLSGVRVVLVEDEDDRRFHQWAYDRARELDHLPANPRLVFMPVNARGGGGKAPVMKRLAALQKEGLGSVHRGLIDGDNEADQPPEGVVRLERYTLENYLADPIALYCAAVSSTNIDEELLFSREGGVKLGDLGTLRAVDAGTLQRIANLVLARMEQAVPQIDRTRRSLTLHGDAGAVPLEYPRWLFSMSKKDLRTALGKLSKAIVNDEHLHSGPERAGLVPEDLIAAYRRLATNRS
ncbi:MAG TPA: AAA family ATPase [Kofleriaceae bacterium]|nr:AAA family ATPase [Kofleriaceae bacterium]